MFKLIYMQSLKQIELDGKIIYPDKILAGMDFEKEAFKYLEFIEKQTVKGLRMEDLFTYDGISLFYFDRPSLFNKVKELVFYVSLLDKIIKLSSEELYVETDELILYNISTRLFKLSGNLISKSNINDNITFKNRFRLISRLLKGILCLLVTKMEFKFYGNKKPNFLVVTHAADINKIKFGEDYRFYDTQLGKVIEELKKKYRIINFQLLNNMDMICKTQKYKEKYIPLEIFSIYKRFFYGKLINEALITDNLSQLSLYTYEFMGYDLKYIMTEDILKDIKEEYTSYLKEILAAERLLKKLNIYKCLIAGDGDRGRCFITAANRNGIGCYSVQHGIINDVSPSYMLNSTYKYLVPVKLFVWGEDFKELLVNHANVYNDLNVEVVGQVRTDMLASYKKLNNTDKGLRILYATQYILDLLEPATIILFKAINLLYVDYEIVVKLHPADIYSEWYEEKIKEYGIKNIKIVKDGDVYELINWCNIIVSVHSTVVVEGALLNKKSVCILLPQYNDAGNFVKDGVSFGAKNEHELAKILLDAEEKNIEHENNLKRYIHRNFYLLDGEVTKRITNLIY